MKIKSAYIEITNICNLNCSSCYNRSGVPHEKQELSLNQFEKAADKLINEFGCERISLSGGEPTLHSEFYEILNFLLDKFVGLQISVVTNGTTVNDELIRAYNKHDNLSLQISLDGSCEEVNARTRGQGNFDKTIRFISKLDKLKKTLVKMVISNKNIFDVEPFYEFIISLRCIPEYDFISNIGNASQIWQKLHLTAQQKLSVLRSIKELNQKHGVDSNLPYCTSSCPLVNSDSEHSVLIKTDGSVYPCQLLYNDSYALGNILTDCSEKFIDALGNISDMVETRVNTDYGCLKCLAKTFCKKGCIALAEMNNGDPLANDGECDFRKLQLVGFHTLKYRSLENI